MSGISIDQRIEDFIKVGHWLKSEETVQLLASQAYRANPWFTQENVKYAIESIAQWLTEDALHGWIDPYSLPILETNKSIGVVMAGNIPLAGFHDFLSVLISGFTIKVKLSSQDPILIRAIGDFLCEINPDWISKIQWVEQVKSVDGVIATGSNNTARYFEYYFRKIPLLLRKNRSSVAVLTGHESADELKGLAFDILSYFGLGCRNVSLIFLPRDTPLENLTQALLNWSSIIDHHKYANSYTYQRALLLMDMQPFTDTGYCVLRESNQPSTPIGVIHYWRYEDKEDVVQWINDHPDEIQCIVSKCIENSIAFGQAQHPGLKEYADHLDTLKFLTGILGY